MPRDYHLTPRALSACNRVASAAAVVFAVLSSSMALAAHDLVISQIYGNSGAFGAAFQDDYVEIFNRGAQPINLDNKSIQYASATGTGFFSSNPVTPLTGTLAPGQYYLVRMTVGGFGAVLPTPDATGSVNLHTERAKVALVDQPAGLACNGGSTPCSATQLQKILDLVGYGTTTNFFEGSGTAPSPTATLAILRGADGCQDTDDNRVDFATAAAAPRNTHSPLKSCAFVVNCPAQLTTLQGTAVSALLTARDGAGTVTAATEISAAVPGIRLAGFTAAPAIGGEASVTLQVDESTLAGTYPVEVSFTSGAQARSCTVQVEVASAQPGVVRIHDIQGPGHRSPYVGKGLANVPGIVTAVRDNGFYLQDPRPDADNATSEGIFVFTQTAPKVAVGDSVLVTGAVTEFRPGNDERNLSSTQLAATSLRHLSSGNALPAPTVIGTGGRVPPAATINSGNCADVETACTFDPVTDGIDFYESLEGMRVQINNAVVVGPTNAFGEAPVLADFGAGASQATPRGGVYVAAADFNPERVILDDQIVALPGAEVGDRIDGVIGVLDYSFGNFKLQVTQPVTLTPNAPVRETTAAQRTAELAIAGFNVENLSPASPPEKFIALAEQIVHVLRSPDIIAVSEVQDNNGPVNDSVVDASQTIATLTSAIASAGGPTYEFRSIDPVDDQDGGQPGANIRQGFLYNPARVAFVYRPGGSATAATAIVNAGGAAQLSASPGRVDPGHPAFLDSRKPLAGEFRFNGHNLIVIANHFNSKSGDDPLFGRHQPPVLTTQLQREQQAAVVHDFVRSILSVEPGANVVVLGDLNDFQFSSTLDILKSVPLTDLGAQLPDSDRYTFIFDGNSQTLDHILMSDNLRGAQYDIVHVNAEYAQRASDHDPVVARLYLPAREVTGQTTSFSSGLLYSRSTQRFTGTLSVTNTGSTAIQGPVHIQLSGLPSQITMVNQTGTYDGSPYISYPAALGPGETISVPVVFLNPLRVLPAYSVRVFSGNL